jgi:hypothetical protein
MFGWRRRVDGGQVDGGLDLVTRYRHWRGMSTGLNHRLVESLATDALKEGGGNWGYARVR